MVTGTLLWFSHRLGRIIPTDELIFFRGVGQPPTRTIQNHVSAFFPGKWSTGRFCWGDAGGSLGHVCRVDHSAVACEYQLRHCAAASATGDPAWRQAVTRQKMQMPYIYRSENQHIIFDLYFIHECTVSTLVNDVNARLRSTMTGY